MQGVKTKGNSLRATPSANSPYLFGTLIHSCYSTTQRPALGQISIGTVGQYWVGANTLPFTGMESMFTGIGIAPKSGNVRKAQCLESVPGERHRPGRTGRPSSHRCELIHPPSPWTSRPSLRRSHRGDQSGRIASHLFLAKKFIRSVK